MKKQIALALVAFVAATTSLFGQASFSFNDGVGTPNDGTYTPGSNIVFTINVVFSGPNPNDLGGISYWFQSFSGTPTTSLTEVGGLFTITTRDVTGSPFTDVQTGSGAFPQPLNFDDTAGNVAGNENRFDLGASLSNAPGDPGLAPNTYLVAQITFSISGAITPGSYTLGTIPSTATQGSFPDFGKGAVASNNAGTSSVNIPATFYTVTIVPEPATWSLMVLGGLACVGVTAMRRRRG